MEVQKKQKTEKSSHLEDCKHYPRHQPPPNEMTIKERNSYRISAAGGAQRTSSSYNHSILKELILYYKNKLEQEKDIYSKDCGSSCGYWCGDLVIGWCTYGRIIAANLLQVPLEQNPRTNNHLESFHSELKMYQLQKHQNDGHLLRLGFLSVILIISIVLNILLKRDLKQEIAKTTQRKHRRTQLKNESNKSLEIEDRNENEKH
ncbi:hypothetical protein GLOIN_2v1777513 [Rhizophagus clarus]|uniref:Uncharacterized protein n=1 Tax=Rhizophagus clarus TaxID=94130 RepID=A0A8H3KXN8_9GLOM|nr:hypothetical protein GLOIN_2v1777513 [Rhizophagus clarus]